MQLTEAKSEGLLRVYDVRVPAADLERKLSEKIEEVRPKVRINGFRPGKVPASHIRKVYGASFMQDIINETVQATTKASLDQGNARAASQPRLDWKSDLKEVAAGNADLAFELSIEIMPDFEPLDLKSIKLTRPIAEVDDAQTEDAAAELAKSQKYFEAKDGPAAEGDAVILDFVGKIDDVAFDGGAAEGATVVIGSNRFIPGFEEQLVGVKAGDEKILNVSFPDDYAAENLKGRQAAFETKIKEVRESKESQVDAAFAERMGFDSLPALKDALRQRLVADHSMQSRAKAKRALFDRLDEAHDFELPPRMVEAEFNEIWRQVESDRAAGRNDPSDVGKNEDELRAEYRKISERRVRLGLILAEIGRRNQVAVTDQEVAQAVAAQARRYPGQERQVYEAYQKNPGLIAQIRAPLYEEKVVDYILELAQVTDETVTRDELFAEDDEDMAGSSAQVSTSG